MTLPELLAERTDKFDGELRAIKSRHRQEVGYLEEKVRRLEEMLREKERVLGEQQQEIVSLREGSMSGRAMTTNTFNMTPQRAEYIERENLLLRSKLKRNSSGEKYEPSWAASAPNSFPMSPMTNRV